MLVVSSAHKNTHDPTGTDPLNFGIADDNFLTIDDADAAQNDYCKLTTVGVVGMSYSEVLKDLSEQAAETFDFNDRDVTGVDKLTAASVDVTNNQDDFTVVSILNSTAGNSAAAGIELISDSAEGYIRVYSGTFSNAELADKLVLQGAGSAASVAVASLTSFEIYTGGLTGADLRLTIDADGDLALNTTLIVADNTNKRVGTNTVPEVTQHIMTQPGITEPAWTPGVDVLVVSSASASIIQIMSSTACWIVASSPTVRATMSIQMHQASNQIRSRLTGGVIKMTLDSLGLDVVNALDVGGHGAFGEGITTGTIPASGISILCAGDIVHEGDANTLICFDTDTISLTAGGRKMFETFKGSGGAPDKTAIDGPLVYTPSTTQDITAAGGIAVTHPTMRIQGDGGAIDITANPQIAAGWDSQRVVLEFMHATNTVKLEEGNGLKLDGGVSFTGGQYDMMEFGYNLAETLWKEISRSNAS